MLPIWIKNRYILKDKYNKIWNTKDQKGIKTVEFSIL